MNPKDSYHDPNAVPNDDEKLIAAYVCGDLDEAARAVVERRMAKEPAFRREVEEWMRTLDTAREWMDAPPPGIEKVAGLSIPPLPLLPAKTPARRVAKRPSVIQSRRPVRTWALQWLTAAALFLLGLFTGRWLFPAGPALESPHSIPAAHDMQAAPAPLPSPGTVSPSVKRPAAIPPAAVPNKPAPVMQSDAASGRRAPSAPVRSVREANGRLIVESTLASTGAQAVWVVDGNFQLAQADSLNAGGSQ